jgi:hypothetical protein
MCMFCRSLFVLCILVIVFSVLLRYTDSDYHFGILWPLWCLFFFDIRLLITTLVSCGHCGVCSSSIYGFWLPLWYLLVIVFSVLLRYTDSDYHFGFFKLFFLKSIVTCAQSAQMTNDSTAKSILIKKLRRPCVLTNTWPPPSVVHD